MRKHRFLFMILGAALVFSASLQLSYALRYDFAVPDYARADRDVMVLWLIPFKLLLLWRFRQLDALPSFFGWADVRRIAAAMILAAGIHAAFFALIGRMTPLSAPRGVILADLLLSTTGLFALRTLFTLAGRGSTERWWRDETREPVAVLGANEIGLHLVKQLRAHVGGDLYPLCFLDEDPAKKGGYLHDVPIVGGADELPRLHRKYPFERLILAQPDLPPARLRQILGLARAAHCKVDIFHPFQGGGGGSALARLHPPRIEDLLGRPELRTDIDSIRSLLRGQQVCITGAGGSIGAELARQCAAHAPAVLHLVERCENALYTIETELRARFPSLQLRPWLLDVRDVGAVDLLLSRYPLDLLFHSAAHKHVPITEREPLETLRNNSLATRTLALAACRHHVTRFVFISTDKAVLPENWLGLSKQLAERFLRALQVSSQPATRFSIVRFGNVLNSSGSVVPLFRRQIDEGGPVTVTHPDVRRYFMSIPEAVGLILQCAAFSEGQGTYVLDMGEQIRILDLARQMIELSGLRPDTDIPIVFTGLRPGEKLSEVLVADGEARQPTPHPGIHRIHTPAEDPSLVSNLLDHLASLPDDIPEAALRALLFSSSSPS